MPGETTAPLNQLLDPSAWATYRRTCTKLLHRSFSLPFLAARWPGRRRVSRHAASHISAVPAPIGYCSGAIAPGAHTARTQPPYLGAPETTLPLHHGVCVRARVCEPSCNLQLEQGWLSYGWRYVKIIDGVWAIGSTKKEGRNSYGGGWYWLYGKLPK